MKLGKSFLFFFILFFLVFNLSFVLASVSFGYGGEEAVSVEFSPLNVNTFINSTDATNVSDYWDSLNTPADINTADITDDNTYVQVAGDTMTGSLIINENLTVNNINSKDSNISFYSDGGTRIMTIDGDSNRLGIGTDAPEIDLHVRSDGSTLIGSDGTGASVGFKFRRRDGASGSMFSGATQVGFMYSDTFTAAHTTDAWATPFAGTTRLQLTSDGDLTLTGTSSKFLIRNDQGATGDILAGVLMTPGGGTNKNIVIVPSASSGQSGTVQLVHYNGVKFASMLEYTTDGNSNTDLLLVKSGGNVGIGTTAPGNELEVVGTVNASNFKLVDNGKSYYGTADDSSITYDGSDMVFDSQEVGNGDFVFSNGKMGIGTASPSFKLEVAGDIGVDDYITHNGDTNTEILFLIDRILLIAGAKSLIDLQTSVIEFGDGTDIDIDFNDGMFFEGSSGNFGIGTTTPTHKLNVVGDVNITGDLIVHGQNTTVPDYVFEEGYNLMSLYNVESYITENEKLPPSKIQGDFSDGNIVKQQNYLLEKVEELTLHIIEQQKEIDDLKIIMEGGEM